MRLFNSLTKNKEELENNTIQWYSCGPTVYDHSHLGHARNYVMNDVARRVLISEGYDVQFVMNITDLDDKIIERAKEEGVTHREIAQKYEESFWEDMESLNVLLPDTIVRVTEKMDLIVSYIEGVIESGFAYESNGSIYFKNQKFKDTYPDIKTMEPDFDPSKMPREGIACLRNDEKEHPEDFALWKAAKEGEPSWESPWGQGRPGWHIECSALSHSIFGTKLDIHSGGIDLTFPHHSNEIKQSVAYNMGEKWVDKFIHAGHLHIDGKKMSKSLKNFITIKETLKVYTPNQIRFMFLDYPYGDPLTFTESHLEKTNGDLKRIGDFLKNVDLAMKSKNRRIITKQLDSIIEQIRNAINDNINTKEVIRIILELISEVNLFIDDIRHSTLLQIKHIILWVLRKFGIEFSETKRDDTKMVDAFVQFRDSVRNWAFQTKSYDLLKVTDVVRNEILPKLGVQVEDLGKGVPSVWKPT